MNTSLRFRLRYALHPVYAAFILHSTVRALAGKGKYRFLDASHLGIVQRDHLGLVAAALSIALVHAHQIRTKERGFIPAGAGADLDNDVFIIVGIFGKQQRAQLLREGGELLVKLCKLRVSYFPEFRVAFLRNH